MDGSLPLRVVFSRNTNRFIKSVRITVDAPTRIASFVGDERRVEIIPVSDRVLVVRTKPDTSSFAIGENVEIARLLTDDVTRNQSFTIEALDAADRVLFSETKAITISRGVVLPRPCSMSYVPINTGPGTRWRVVCKPGDPISPLVPFVLSAIPPNWYQSANWIGPQADGMASAYPGEYCYELAFCARYADTADLKLEIAADNKVTEMAWLTGTTWTSLPLTWLPSGSHFQNMTSTSMKLPIVAGENHLRVKVNNHGGQTGLLLENSRILLNYRNLGFIGDTCCRPASSICGVKFWDKNCNGRRDAGDVPIANWPIELHSPIAGFIGATTTDAEGRYCFDELNAGQYIVREKPADGFTPHGSAESPTINLAYGQSATWDFYNCKTPSCPELFTNLGSDSVCCSGRFNISNPVGVACTELSFYAIGGVVTGVTTSCPSMLTFPTTGLTSGTIAFGPSCAGVDVDFNATSTTATGIVKVIWTGTFAQGSSRFTCSDTIEVHCKRMPKECRPALTVANWAFDELNQDWRTFRIDNSKLPASRISSVDIQFVDEPVPYHTGGGLYVDDPSNSVPWTFSGSGGPSKPYTEIRMNCDESGTGPHGDAASDWVAFNLGVDATTAPPYNGVVHITVGYCDGDTCVYTYDWLPPVLRRNDSALGQLILPEDLIVFGLTVQPQEDIGSFSLSLDDTTATIVAVSVEQPGSGVGGLSPRALRNTVQYSLRSPVARPIPLVVVYDRGKDAVRKIRIRYFDTLGREISQAEREISGVRVSEVPPEKVGGATGLWIEGVVPNPTAGWTTCTYSLAQSEQARLELFDALGRSITILSDRRETAGRHTLEFQAGHLERGTYFLRLSTPSGEASATLQVLE